MITFTNLGLYGRLGNALFQYAFVRAVSLKTGKKLCLPDLSQHIDPVGGQRCKLTHFNIEYEPLLQQPSYLYREQGHGVYDPNVFSVQDGTDFFGHFQNRLYFDDIREQLKEDFQLSEDIQTQAKDIISQYKNPTSIHVRLGDYKDMDQGVEGWQEKLTEYLRTARNVIGDSGDFLVFTGGKRHSTDANSDFDWCRERLSGNNVHFMEGNSEVLDFELIRRCKNNITGWDSSFSWWASYLNNTDGKIICTKKNQIFPWLYSSMDEWINI